MYYWSIRLVLEFQQQILSEIGMRELTVTDEDVTLTATCELVCVIIIFLACHIIRVRYI